jgi:NADH-quinone oxidoreductase subunit H
MNETFLERLPLVLRDALTGWLPEPWRWLAQGLLVALVVLVVFASLFALLTLVERKFLGRVQNRPGPNRTGLPYTDKLPFLKFTEGKLAGLGQPMADGIKMLTKEDVVPRDADQTLHFLAPVAMLAMSVMTFAVLPYGRNLVPVELDASILYFFAAGAATELAVFMAGWGSRNKYALLAAMRALAQLISYELPLILSFVPVVMIAGSLSTTGVVAAQSAWHWGFVPHWYVLTPWGFAGFVIFMIAALAESNRSPFDLPEAESELIAGHLTEYSGFKYALFFMAEYFGMTALSGMAVTLFLGGWYAPLPALQFIPSYAWFAAKLLTLLMILIWIRATLPRLRIDQLMRLSWKFLVPLCLVNLANAVVWHLTASLPLGVRWLLGAVIILAPFWLIGRRLTKGNAPRTYRYAA